MDEKWAETMRHNSHFQWVIAHSTQGLQGLAARLTASVTSRAVEPAVVVIMASPLNPVRAAAELL